MNSKKKVLIGYIVDGYAGGVDKYILNLISTVKRDKYEIDLLTNHTNSNLYEKLKEQGIGLIEIPSLKHPVKQYKRIKYIIQKNTYDTVYLNISTAVHCIGVLAAANCKVKNRVVHSHSSGVDIENKYKRWIMILIHFICKNIISTKATTFIACSQKAGEWMFSKKVLKSDDYFVVHNSVDLKKFVYDEKVRDSIRAKMGWTDKKVLIHVANFTYQKNNEFMIEVFKEAKTKQENLILVLIGKGNKEEKIKALVKEYGLNNEVIFLKNISNVNEYLQAADLFLLPSVFEGYPISALEAQICGLPCILSNKITPESKITDTCVFLPLKIQEWVEKIVHMERNSKKVLTNMSECDNHNLSMTIEKLWDR